MAQLTSGDAAELTLENPKAARGAPHSGEGGLLGRLGRAAAREFVHGAHFTSITLAGAVTEGMLLMGLPVNLPLLLAAYLIPLVIYNVDHLRGIAEDARTNPERSAHLQAGARMRRWLVVGYVVALATVCIAFAPLAATLTTCALLVAGLAYPKRLTAIIPAFKSFYVSFSIVSILVLGMTWNHASLGAAVVVAFTFMWLRLFMNVVFSDIKDIESDAAEGLRTIPVMLGERSTFVLLYALNLAAFVPIALGVRLGVTPPYALSLLLFAPYAFAYMRAAQLRDKHEEADADAGGSRRSLLTLATHAASEGEQLLAPIVLIVAGLIFGL